MCRLLWYNNFKGGGGGNVTKHVWIGIPYFRLDFDNRYCLVRSSFVTWLCVGMTPVAIIEGIVLIIILLYVIRYDFYSV